MADYSELIKMGKNTSLMSNLFVGQSLPSLRIMLCASDTHQMSLAKVFMSIVVRVVFENMENW